MSDNQYGSITVASPCLTWLDTHAGSVAAIKVPQLTELLLQLGEVKVATTKAAAYFVTQQQLSSDIGHIYGEHCQRGL